MVAYLSLPSDDLEIKLLALSFFVPWTHGIADCTDAPAEN
jgi:hypothetical protein